MALLIFLKEDTKSDKACNKAVFSSRKPLRKFWYIRARKRPVYTSFTSTPGFQRS